MLVSFEILFKLFLICVDLTRTLWTSRMWMGIRSVIHIATSQVVVRRGSIVWMPHNCFFFIWARTYGIKVFPKTGLYNPLMLASVEYETMAMVMR